MTAVGATLLISDVHAHYGVVDNQVVHAEQTLGVAVARVVVLGDFGLFGANLHDHFRRDGRRFVRPVSFIEGNHEDFREFDELVTQFGDVITHLPRGTCQQLGSVNALCLGGARYMDAWSTPAGSEITDRDIAQCLVYPAGSVDVILSHDCPTDIGVTNSADMGHLGAPGVPAFPQLARHHQPSFWFFGHHHRWHDFEANGTRYLGLPQSWQGYALLHDDGSVEPIRHDVELPKRPSWWRWIGLR